MVCRRLGTPNLARALQELADIGTDVGQGIHGELPQGPSRH